MILTLLTVAALVCAVLCIEPNFDVPMVNVTVVVGHTAVLPCSIDNLAKNKIVWVDPYDTLLTLQDRRIIDDVRIHVERFYTKEWNLHIENIRQRDGGTYMCQINTNPVKMKHVLLHVHAPAKIIKNLSSDDVVALEGETVTLVCNVTGVPRPSVTWYRQATRNRNAPKERIGVSGEVLLIHNVTRYCDDIYECIAYNGVPPAVNRQIRVSVEFPPEIYLPNRRISQSPGKDTILECMVTAFPHGITIWKRNGEKIVTGAKYRVEAYDEGENMITLSLRIRSVDEYDYGNYVCVAENKLGKDRDTMLLYEPAVKYYPTKLSTSVPFSTESRVRVLPVTSTQRNRYNELPRWGHNRMDGQNGDYITNGRTHNQEGADTTEHVIVPPPREKYNKNDIGQKEMTGNSRNAGSLVLPNTISFLVCIIWICLL